MDNVPYITIFTPTYNREKELPILFGSLMEQTDTCFEWLIVNDGSIDNTTKLLDTYVKQAHFPIRIINTVNGGKHRAVNKGMKQAKGVWFAIVDSDDYLLRDAVNEISQSGKEIKDESIAALSFLKNNKGKVIGDFFCNPDSVDSFVNYYDNGIRGDKFHVLKTSVLTQFSFPEFIEENFIAESALYLPFGSKYNTRFINKAIYVCEYLDGGLSDISLINRTKCTNGALYVYKLRFELSNKLSVRLNGAVNWWRFYFHGKINKNKIVVDRPNGWAKLCFIFGFLAMLVDLFNLRK